MADLSRLAALLGDPGPWTYAYVDGPGQEPQVVEESREDAVRRRLDDARAPEADADAITRALRTRPGLPAPSTRYLLVRAGELELDEELAGARFGPEIIGHGPVPPVLPLLRHEDADVGYLVVETGREGAQVRAERAGRRPDVVEDVEGRTDALPKVQAGGWSHARYQRTSEEIWKLNQTEVAEHVDRLVREREPAFIVIAGDVRARQYLRDGLSPASAELLVEVDVHTRAAGADDSALETAIAEELETHHDEDLTEAEDRAEEGHGRRGAHGVGEVIDALQQARVDTLLLDARMLDSDERLDALAAPPWVGRGDPLGVGSLGTVPAAEALTRAAVLSGARVLVAEDEPDEPDAPREDRPPRPPLAVLRWAREEAELDNG